MLYCYNQNGQYLEANASVPALTRLYFVKTIEVSTNMTFSDNSGGTLIWSAPLTPLILTPNLPGDRINLFHQSPMNYTGYFFCTEPFRHVLYYTCTPTAQQSGLTVSIAGENFSLNVTDPPAQTDTDGWSVQFDKDTRVFASRLGIRRAYVRINTNYTTGGITVPLPKFAGEVWFLEFLQNDTYRFVYLPVSNKLVIYNRSTGSELADGTPVDTTVVCHVEYVVR